MIKKDDYYIIENEEDLKNPVLCYCLMMRFMEEAGEDFVDYNCSIVNPFPFVTWMKGKEYITNDQIDNLLSDKELHLQDVICGGEILFPNTCGEGVFSEHKCYQLLAEYISSIKTLRERLYDSVNNKAYSFTNDEFYKNKDGISLACIIPVKEVMIGINNLHPKNQIDMFDWTYAEMYDYVKNMTIEESDIDLEY